MKILNTNQFVSERIKVQPVTNAELEVAAKPNDNPQNIEEFKYWLSYYKYEYEMRKTNFGDNDGVMVAVKDKKRPQYTICFDFVGKSPKAYEFIYFIEKVGMVDSFYWDSCSHEIGRIKNISTWWLDVKESYKINVVEWRKKQLAKAKREYQKELKKDWKYASHYKVDMEEAKLEKVMDKYNSI